MLINEFGEIGLDHQLVEQIDDTTILLNAGCLCCTVQGDLVDLACPSSSSSGSRNRYPTSGAS